MPFVSNTGKGARFFRTSNPERTLTIYVGINEVSTAALDVFRKKIEACPDLVVSQEDPTPPVAPENKEPVVIIPDGSGETPKEPASAPSEGGESVVPEATEPGAGESKESQESPAAEKQPGPKGSPKASNKK